MYVRTYISYVCMYMIRMIVCMYDYLIMWYMYVIMIHTYVHTYNYLIMQVYVIIHLLLAGNRTPVSKGLSESE